MDIEVAAFHKEGFQPPVLIIYVQCFYVPKTI